MPRMDDELNDKEVEESKNEDKKDITSLRSLLFDEVSQIGISGSNIRRRG